MQVIDALFILNYFTSMIYGLFKIYSYGKDAFTTFQRVGGIMVLICVFVANSMSKNDIITTNVTKNVIKTLLNSYFFQHSFPKIILE